MDLKNYAEIVYFQFYRKVEELDFFITEAADNAFSYKDAPAPKDNFYFDKMQFTFSACINALVSTWEIAKLSKSLANELGGLSEREGLVSEMNLESNPQVFAEYFDCDPAVHYWFRFMKDARNANAHDGSFALNGGNIEEFLFQTDLHRFKWDGKSKRFAYVVSESPKGNAVCVILKAAIALVPAFENKLERPILSLGDHYASAKFKLESIVGLLNNFRGKESELIGSMVQAQIGGQKNRSCEKQLESWARKLESM
ncbi:hypothetical protein [Hydrogenophaga sp. SL48]|uniref:hypothetical protein n=1 Tax=Hydrogenophaga sp. SL48 TaxID=2806347 RepID=UPI001F177835|nr:hypothetical protein [Hydrogenophaga sp. SL48]UJW79396.1 hypothetical protein IM738_16045 [Hydrogenophaga sp. SL48]